MSQITKVESALYRIPLPRLLADSTHHTISHFELVTTSIRDADGHEGVGYTCTVDSGGTAIEALVRDYLAPRLAGKDAARINELWQQLWWAVHYGGRGGQASLAIAALDIALWDLAARRAGAPLWQHLGGFDPAVPCYAGGVDLHLGTDDLLRQADGFIEQGFRAIKMKAGRPLLSEDVQRVEAMRRHLGDAFPLMADANMRWSADQAIRAARALAPYGLVWLEEPTIPDDFAGHARIVREGLHPIAAGENLHSLYEFKELIAQGGVTFPEPDVTTCGGVTVFMKVAALAEAFNLPVTSHGAHDITVHLLAAAPNRSFLEVHGFGLDRFIESPMKIEDGKAIASNAPGHGVAFNRAALEPHRRR